MLAYMILALTILLTSALSGVLGMGGGLILMGVMAAILPIGAAMVLHGLTQMTANGFRAWLLQGHISWRIVGSYAIGATMTLALLWQVRYVPDTITVYLILGGLPLLVMALPKRITIDATRPSHAVVCGVAVTTIQLTAGVAGPLLDVFFVASPLDRRCVVATKAVTQTLSHAMKIVYFGTMVTDTSVPGWMYGTAILLALGGTIIGRHYLELLDDNKFRRWSRRLILGICIIYVGKAALAYAA